MRLGAVAYLNMQPLVWGLQREPVQIRYGTPSQLAAWLEAGELDLAMAPAAALLAHPHWRIAGRSMIGARGPVQSVILMGSHPIEQWRTVRPDSHSLTSNALARIVLERALGLAPHWGEPLPADGWTPPAAPAPGEALVAIGSRALAWRGLWREPAGCTIDLGEAWMDWTGLPFVFAVWAARPGARLGDWPEKLEALKRRNLERLDEIAAAWPHLAGENLTAQSARDYLIQCVDYELDGAALAGLERFYAEGRARGLFAPGWRPLAAD
jgi:predicted solute-binding protein